MAKVLHLAAITSQVAPSLCFSLPDKLYLVIQTLELLSWHPGFGWHEQASWNDIGQYDSR